MTLRPQAPNLSDMRDKPGRKPGLALNGERLQELRLLARLSAAELAKRAGGRDVSTINKLEAGKILASKLLAHQIAHELGVSVSELIRQDVAA